MAVPATGGPSTRRPARQTQAERTAATQRALLDATIDCLVERGYAQLSTHEIVRRAGVSRGAQVHHYPTKSQLVAAAVRHQFGQRLQAFDEGIAALPEGERSTAAVIAQVWDLFRDKTFRGVMEFIVASFSDEALRPVVQQAMVDFDDAVTERFAVLFPGLAVSPLGTGTVRFTFAVLESAALYREMGLDDTAQQIVDVLGLLAQLVDGGLLGPPHTTP